jgi:hypothetical protein
MINEADAARAPVVICLIPVQNTVTTFVERALRTRIGMSSLTAMSWHRPFTARETESYTKAEASLSTLKYSENMLLIFQLARVLSQRLNQLVTSMGPRDRSLAHHLAVTPPCQLSNGPLSAE